MVSSDVQSVQSAPNLERVRSWGSLFIANLLHLLFISLLFMGPIPAASGQEQTHVLLLNSYHLGLSWTDDETSGVRSVLERSGLPIDLHVEYLDTKRLEDKKLIGEVRQLLDFKYRKTKFSAILVTDNDAFNFLRQYRNDQIFSGIPVVFAGVNYFHKEMLAGLEGFTGVAETFQGEQTIDAMYRLHPNTKRIVVIIDSTITGEAIRKDFEPMLVPFSGKLGFEFWDKLSLDQLQKRLPALGSDTLVLLLPFARDSEGTYIRYSDIAEMVSQASPVPVYGVYDFYMGHGIVGGRITSGESQGRAAAEILLRVLRGESPGRIPVMTVAPSEFQFDSRQLHRFSIPVSSLPAGSRILFQSWYELHRVWVWIDGFSIVIVLFFGWGWWRSHQFKRQSEKAQKESEAKLRTVFDWSSNAIFLIHPEGRLLFSNKQAEVLLGYSHDELLKLSIKDTVPEELLARVRSSFKNALDGEHGSYETKLIRKDRIQIFVEVNSVLLPGGEVLCELRNISERKQLEDALKQQLVFITALNNISKVVVENEDAGVILEETVRIVGEVLKADRALIYGISFKDEKVTGLSQWLNPHYRDIPPTKATYPLSVFIGAATELRRSKTWFTSHRENINPHLLADGSGVRLHKKMLIESLLWYPFNFQEEEFFALVLNQTHFHKEWSKEEIGFLDSVSQLISVELEKIRLTEQSKKNEDELRIAATAFESNEGMIITDADKIILRVNKSFTAITGYSGEDVIGLNPRILNSSRHDDNFFAAMWRSVNDYGIWEGEIWNKRKNGEIYPEHLTITAVMDSNNTVTNYVAAFTDITQSKNDQAVINNLAFYDALTSLPNRRLLHERIQRALIFSARTGKNGALLFIDLDNFKTLNDTLGHDVGDLLLQQVANRLKSCVREGDTVARLGGDEFVVMLESLSENERDALAQIESIGLNILSSVSRPYQLATHQFQCTSSIGATVYSESKQNIDELFKQADIAMYQAKKLGRNKLCFFDKRMQDAINFRVAQEADLRMAIERNQLVLHYQVKVDSEHLPIGAEALIRWQHPERGLIPPLDFIPLAEENGLILPIGQWVIEAACKQLVIWSRQIELAHLSIAVNVSALQFHQEDFTEQVVAALQHTGANPQLLMIELTEGVLLADIESVISKMGRLKMLGVSFSLDDFGTGYSSLSYLTRLPLDEIKIDRSFVMKVGVCNDSDAISAATIGMARSLKLKVVAEGVETGEQVHVLGSIHKCDYLQGHWFGKPVPVEQFEVLFK